MELDDNNSSIWEELAEEMNKNIESVKRIQSEAKNQILAWNSQKTLRELEKELLLGGNSFSPLPSKKSTMSRERELTSFDSDKKL